MAPPRFPDFMSFFTGYVEARRGEVAPAKRLDGLVGVETPNRPIARFDHAGHTWGVDGDTHFEPLEIAARALQSERGRDPFIVSATKTGLKLVLRAELDALRLDRGARSASYLYAYAQAPRT